MTGQGTRFLVQTAIVGSILAVIVAMAPGDSSWMEPGDVKRLTHPLPPIGATDIYSLQTFPGGDGVTNLVGRLYLPQVVDSDSAEHDKAIVQPPPVVVMAHGLGLVQDAKLTPFIQAYLQEGIAVMTFDYATFGWSDGWPRHQAIPNRRLADWHAALAHVRKNLGEKVDIQRMALWGFSLGGGHVLSVAATEPDIKAVIATLPHVKSGLEGVIVNIMSNPFPALLGLAKVSGALVKWATTELLQFSVPGHVDTMYIPLHGVPGSAAIMQNPGDDEGYGSLVTDLPSSIKWENRVSVSSVLPILFYRPLNVVNQISSPTLLLAAELDTLCPPAAVEAAAARMDQSKTKLVLLRDTSHFQVYDGQPLQRVLEESRAFLVAALF